MLGVTVQGGMCMEEFIDQRLFNGVFDLTTHEITDWLYQGFMQVDQVALKLLVGKAFHRLLRRFAWTSY
jgi:uncharacterized protein (UPF0261 family)